MTTLSQRYDQPAAERATRAFLDKLNADTGPPLETLSPAEARAVLEKAQAKAGAKLPPAEVTEKTIPCGGESLRLVIVRPLGATGVLPAFMFFHGGGWVIGDFPTHERCIRDLVNYSGAAAVYVDYSRSPEAKYPVALEQCYAATRWVAEHGGEVNLDGSRLAVAGNSVGGNLAAVVALKSKMEEGPKLRLQVLFCPVTNAAFDTPSYQQFQESHFLTRKMMRWFWDSYIPSESDRANILASPLRASLDQLRGLPPALIQTAELDVLRDEGEAYARRLDEAGVEVVNLRMGGMIHDYGLLNALAGVPAVQMALRQAGLEIKRRLA